MSTDSASIALTHHFLIAMPGLEDAVFARSVVYLCEHSERGAMGLIINREADIDMPALFSKLELPLGREDLRKDLVFKGGPVQTDRGFVLHRREARWHWQSTLHLTDEISLTTSRDILDALAAGEGPEHAVIALGYAGWGAGQLEDELSRNGWLTVDADPAIIFDTPAEQRYQRALSLLGIDPAFLAQEAGHA